MGLSLRYRAQPALRGTAMSALEWGRVPATLPAPRRHATLLCASSECFCSFEGARFRLEGLPPPLGLPFLQRSLPG